MREFLKGVRRVGPPVSSTLLHLSKWIASLREDGIYASRVAAKVANSSNWQLAEKIAETLIQNPNAPEQPLLSKSLQEALFYFNGFESEVDYARFKSRILRHIERQGASAFCRRFLSLFFFNFVWFHTGESFSVVTPSPDSLSKEIQGVERVCNRIVDSIWSAFEGTKKSLDSATASKLVSQIDRAMRGI